MLGLFGFWSLSVVLPKEMVRFLELLQIASSYGRGREICY